MVALITPPSPAPFIPNLPQREFRPDLRLIRGGAASKRTTTVAAVPWRAVGSIVAGLLGLGLILLMVVGVRLSQGTPPAGFSPVGFSSAAVATSSAGASSSSVTELGGRGDLMVTVAAGENLWDVARRVSPNQDVRDLVGALTERNGGSLVVVGQELLIPADLMS